MSEWIKWNGGIRPVESYALVDVRLRNGKEFTSVSASVWRWGRPGNQSASDDIVAYRLPECEFVGMPTYMKTGWYSPPAAPVKQCPDCAAIVLDDHWHSCDLVTRHIPAKPSILTQALADAAYWKEEAARYAANAKFWQNKHDRLQRGIKDYGNAYLLIGDVKPTWKP